MIKYIVALLITLFVSPVASFGEEFSRYQLVQAKTEHLEFDYALNKGEHSNPDHLFKIDTVTGETWIAVEGTEKNPITKTLRFYRTWQKYEIDTGTVTGSDGSKR